MTDPAQPRGDPFLAVGELLDREVALGEILRTLVFRIATEMKADRGTLYLVDRAREELFSKAADLPELPEIRLKLGQGIAGHVAQTGRTINVPLTDSDTRWYSGVDEATGYKTRTVLAVPMRDGADRIIGVVQLLNKKDGAFTRDDEVILAALARRAAAAVEATTLYFSLFREPEGEHQALEVDDRFNRIIGESPPMLEAYRITTRAARSEATVLIQGESGTGKELFARAVHVNSERRDRPFVKVDCAALPTTLIENELFGHERGAYTGADRKAEGKFDAARGGTLFLDEIGELPLAAQGKLLRVLQDREFERVGGSTTVAADVRVVAATNRDLERLVAEGRFRSDLYYRIRVVQLRLPALRERGPADLTSLARHFLVAAAKRHGRPMPEMSAGSWERLKSYRWPGNVRELENCIESAVVICDGFTIHPHDLPLPDRAPVARSTAGPIDPNAPAPLDAPALGDEGDLAGRTPAPDDGVAATLEEVERRHILAVLDSTDGNKSETARILGIGRNTLARKLKRYGVD